MPKPCVFSAPQILTPFLPSQQCGGLAGTSHCWWGFAPHLFALQGDWLGCHQSRRRQVVVGWLLLMNAVDVTGDEESDLTHLQMKPHERESSFQMAHSAAYVVSPCLRMTREGQDQEVYIAHLCSRHWRKMCVKWAMGATVQQCVSYLTMCLIL